MSRLLKNGLVEVDGIEAGNGPERKRYAITEAGISDMERWLATSEKPEPYLQSTLCTRCGPPQGRRHPRQPALRAPAQHADLHHREHRGDLADQPAWPTRSS
ncbi:hypothetical protein GCM10010320_75030 [Streptomyces caelestis]|jgi:DNA-binding PadR family transcriptional regulator|nr:hypothetical protein GCM10010320_75030 [Streptomyces caelestis]